MESPRTYSHFPIEKGKKGSATEVLVLPLISSLSYFETMDKCQEQRPDHDCVNVRWFASTSGKCGLSTVCGSVVKKLLPSQNAIAQALATEFGQLQHLCITPVPRLR